MANNTKVKISNSGDPNIQKKNDTADTNEKILTQLMNISQNTMDSADAMAKTNNRINDLITAINTVNNTSSNSPSSSGNDAKNAVNNERIAILKAEREAKEQKAKEESDLRKIRLEQAAFSLNRQKELAKIQDEMRANALAKQAEAELKKDREEAGKYGPGAAIGAVYNNQSGAISKSLTAALTGGFGNLIGLDKVVGAAGSFVGKKLNSLAGAPFQKMAKAREQKKADEKAIDNAIHTAELNQRIQKALQDRGLVGNSGSNAGPADDSVGITKRNKKQTDSKTSSATETNELAGVENRLDKINESLKGMSGDKAATKKEEKESSFFEKILSIAGSLVSKLMANLPTILAIMGAVWIGNKLKQLWDGFTSLSVKIGQKILENGKSIWNGIKGFASKAASGIKSAFSKVAPKISNGIKTLVSGVKNTVSKVVTPLKNLGGKVAAGISKLGQTGVGKAVGKIASKVGGFAAKTGKVFGKVLGPVMSLMETGSVFKDMAKKGVAGSVEDYKKNWKWTDYLNPSKMAAVGGAWIGDKVGDLMSWFKHKGKTPEQEAAEMLAKKNGTTVEEELAKLKVTPAEKAAQKQSMTVAETKDTVMYGDINKLNEAKKINDAGHKKAAEKLRAEAKELQAQGKIGASAARYDIAKEHEKLIGNKPINGASTYSEGNGMYAIELDRNLVTDSGQLSAEGIMILQRSGRTEEELQQIQDIITQSITNNNGSNIYQTNVTQHNDTGVYATGDAARTMTM